MQTVWKSPSDRIKGNEKKTYLAYLSENGKNELYGYYDNVRDAKTERAIQDADYGATASRLLSDGLSNSGYQDYIKSSAEKGYLKKLSGAEKEMKRDEYKNGSGYEKYLSDYDTLQTKISNKLIESIGKTNDFNYNNAYEQAISAGLSQTLAQITASKAVIQAKNNAYLNAVAFAKANNLTAKRAKEYAKYLGLDETYAERVYEEISTYMRDGYDFYSSMSSSDYYDYIMSQSKK